MWRALGVFASGQCELPALVRSVAAMMRIVALRIDRTAKAIPIYSCVVTIICTAFYIYDYQVSMAWFVLVRCRATGDVLSALMVFSTGTTSCIGITKLLYMYVYRKSVQSMVADLLAFDKIPLSPATSANLAAGLRTVKKRAVFFGTVLMVNGIIYSMRPLFQSGRHLVDDRQVLYGLEPMLETPNYQIALVTIITSVIFICFIVSIITALLIITTGYCEARLLALSQELLNIWDDAILHCNEHFDVDFVDDKTAALELNKYIKQRLQGIIVNHAASVHLIKKVGYVFSDAIAVEFILLSISLIADLLGGLEDTYILIPFAMMQVSMDCFTGQKLMDASIVFENAVYECKWENFNASNMKTVQVMLQISQKTLKVSAGGVVTLSFACLMSLIKSVYSAYTALRSSMQ